MKKLFLFLFVVILLAATHSRSQSPHLQFTKYSHEKSIGKGINTIYQDNRGFIWFGGTKGLIRFDGYTHRIFQPPKVLNFYDSFNSIHFYYQSPDITGDNFWLCVKDRLFAFNISGHSFTDVVDEFGLTRLKEKKIHSIYKTSDGNLWFGTEKNIYHYAYSQRNNTLHWQFFKTCNCEKYIGNRYETAIIGIAKRDTNSFWIIYKQGVIYYNFTKNIYGSINHWHGFPNTGKGEIRSYCTDDKNRLLIGCINTGLYIIDPLTKSIKNYSHNPANEKSISGSTVWSINQDIFDNYWIGTERAGLNLFYENQNKFIHYKPDEKDFYSIGNKTINDVYVDSSGVIWVSTFTGLNYANLKKKKFNCFQTDPENNTSAHIKSLVFYKKNAWVATDNGLYCFDKELNKKSHYNFDPQFKNGPSHYIISSIDVDAEGMLWLGTYNGLNTFDTNTNTFGYFFRNENDSSSIVHNFINYVYVDRTNTVWIATNAGLARYNRKSNDFKRYIPPEKKKHRNGLLFGWNVYRIVMDKYKNLWITTNKGLNKLNIKTGKFTFYDYLPKDKNNNPQAYFAGGIYYDGNNVLWIASGLGLLKFNIKEERFVPYNSYEKTENYSLNQMEMDLDSNLWIGTNSGLLKFDVKNSTIKKYTVEDGLITNRLGGYATHDGNNNLYFSSIKGIIRFHPDSIKKNSFIPPVYITSLKILNKDVNIGDTIDERILLKQAISLTRQITLTHKHSVITLEFTALNYSLNKKNQYLYKLENFDNEWIKTNANRRYATYTNLSPGNYVFKVRGSNNDGVWNSEPAILKIRVLPHPLKTWWAYLAYTIIVVIIVYIVIRLLLLRERLKGLLKLERFEAEKNREIQKMKIKFFTNISHEFRTPLTLIIGPLEKIISMEGLKDEVKKMTRIMLGNTRRLQRLINQLLDYSKLDAGYLKLKVNKGDLVLYIEKIYHSFKYQAERYNIAYHFSSSSSACNCYFDFDKIDKILYNLIGNSFKYTPVDGKISVNLQISQNSEGQPARAKITITDTGPGISESEIQKVFDRFYNIERDIHKKDLGTGIGLSLAKQLTKIHHGTLILQNIPDSGLCCTLEIPVHKNDFKESEILKDSTEFKDKIKEIETEGYTLNDYRNDSTKSHDNNYVSQDNIVLIIDDNYDIREYIKSELEQHYKVYEAVNGRAGKEIAEKTIPDLIICDVMMPEIDGYELTKILKNNQLTSHIPIILLTAKASATSQEKGLEYGADDYISKPFNLRVLKFKIKNILETRKKYREQLDKDGLYLKLVKTPVTSVDEQFMEKALQVVEKHITDKSFDMDYFGKAMGMSRVQLYRKLKSIANQTPTNFINIVRLERAKHLIQISKANMSEIAYQTGFNSPAYFSKCFREHFGISPSDFAAQSLKKNNKKYE